MSVTIASLTCVHCLSALGMIRGIPVCMWTYVLLSFCISSVSGGHSPSPCLGRPTVCLGNSQFLNLIWFVTGHDIPMYEQRNYLCFHLWQFGAKIRYFFRPSIHEQRELVYAISVRTAELCSQLSILQCNVDWMLKVETKIFNFLPTPPPTAASFCVLPYFLETNKWIFNLCNGKDAK